MKNLFIPIIFLGSLFGESTSKSLIEFPLFEDYEYTYLVSCSRSGNTFCRFLIEYLLKVPTCMSKKNSIQRNKINTSLGGLLDFEVDFFSAPVIKKHDFINHYWLDTLEDHPMEKGKVIFILRNPIRHYLIFTEYFKLLKDFDSHTGEKMLIYFEDLISDPIKEIMRISTFINKPICEKRLIEYQNNREKLNEQSAVIYTELALPILDTYQDPNSKINSYLESNNLNEIEIHKQYSSVYKDLYEKYLSRYYKSEF